MSEEIKSHLFAIRTTGGQEKVVMRLLEAKANANQINIQSVLLVDNLRDRYQWGCQTVCFYRFVWCVACFY